MSPAAFIDDPRWYAFLPETREGGKKRHLPTHEDCARLDVESAAAHLRAGGTLGAMAGYEERPGQIAMLEAVARAFNSREHLMIERVRAWASRSHTWFLPFFGRTRTTRPSSSRRRRATSKAN